MNIHTPSRQAKKIWRIVEMIDQKDISSLVTVMEKGSQTEQFAVLCGLGRVYDHNRYYARLAPYVAKQLKHPSPRFRLAALRANEYFRYFSSDTMLQLVDDPSPAVISELLVKMDSVKPEKRGTIWWQVLAKLAERNKQGIIAEFPRLKRFFTGLDANSLSFLPAALRLASHHNHSIRNNVLEFLIALNKQLTPTPVTLKDAARIVNYIEYSEGVIELLKPYGRAADPIINKLKHPGIRAIVQLELTILDHDRAPQFTPAQYRYFVQAGYRPNLTMVTTRNRIIESELIKAALTLTHTTDINRRKHCLDYLEATGFAYKELRKLKDVTYTDLDSRSASKRLFALMNILYFDMRETVDRIIALCADTRSDVAQLALKILVKYAADGIPVAGQHLAKLANDTTYPLRHTALSGLFTDGIADQYKRDSAIRAIREFNPVLLDPITDEFIATGIEAYTPGGTYAGADSAVANALAHDLPKSYLAAMLRHTNLKFRLLAYDCFRHYFISHPGPVGKTFRLPKVCLDAMRYSLNHASDIEINAAYMCISYPWSEREILSLLLPLLQNGTRRGRANAAALLLRSPDICESALHVDRVMSPRKLLKPLIENLDKLSDVSAAEVVGLLRPSSVYDVIDFFRLGQREIIKNKALAIASHGSAESRRIMDEKFPEFGYAINQALRNKQTNSEVQTGKGKRAKGKNHE